MAMAYPVERIEQWSRAFSGLAVPDFTDQDGQTTQLHGRRNGGFITPTSPGARLLAVSL